MTVRLTAPDGRWRLYDIVRDPGETSDLSQANPERLRSMRADYEAFARRDRVLAMPPGYRAPAQVQSNAMRELLIPRFLCLLPWGVGAILLTAALIHWLRRRQRVPLV